MTSRQELGAFGERVAAHRLEAAGFAILARNLHLKAGEVDIVAKDGAELVFCEVRTRRGEPGLAGESVDDAKLARLWDCVMEYCDATGHDPDRARIDVVCIDLAPNGRVARIEHLRALEIPGE